MQISTQDACLVYQISEAEDIPDDLSAVLSNPEIIKVGCGINEDCIALFGMDERLAVEGRLDLGGLGGSSKTRCGLANVTHAVLRVNLPKSRRLMLSDW